MKHLGRIIIGASAAACAVYTFVYLYRWEWHRAIVAAVFLVVAEVAIVGTAVLRRLSVLDQRLNALTTFEIPPAATAPHPSPAAASPRAATTPIDMLHRVRQHAPPPGAATTPADVLHRVRDSAPPPRPVFAWLAPDRTGVFLPILLGAGVLASAVAWVVEGLARATARPVLEQRLATRLGVLALPAGGLLGPPPVALEEAAPSTRRWRSPAPARLGLIVVGAAALALGIDALADATQTRTDAARAGVRTVIELQLRGEVADEAPERVVTSLWHTCAGTLRRTEAPPTLTDLGGARFRLEVPVDYGEYTARRVHGCLEDAGLDRVQAGVISFRTVAASSAGSSGPQAGPEATRSVEHPAGGH